MLHTDRGERPLDDCAGELLAGIQQVAALLDAAHGTDLYGASLRHQAAKVADPELTPSARVLREMRDQQLPFFRLAMGYSEQWAQYFRQRSLSPQVQAAYQEETRRSLAAQQAVEQADLVGFDQYLANYFAQYRAL